MDIGFSEEQELLRDTARKFLDSQRDTRLVRRMMATEEIYPKRAKASEIAFGDANWHPERIPRLMRA